MNITTIIAGISTAEKLIPVIESVAKDIEPAITTEIADGKVIWGDVMKAINDLKTAIGNLKTAAKIS